jgi:hypothetical protein
MKKKIIISVFALLITALTSCEKFLNKEPIARVTSIGFYDTETNTAKATNALYDPLGWERFFTGLLFAQGDCASDDAEVGGSLTGGPFEDITQDIMLYKAASTNVQLLNFCQASYVGIQRCNTLLEQTANVDFNAKKYRGQAYFLRGLYYYYLVTSIGPVPLVTKSVGSEDYRTGNRASNDDASGTKQMEKIFQQIINDLDSAANILPTKDQYSAADAGRATKGSAWGYLAKTYSFMASSNKLFKSNNKTDYWNKVIEYSDKIKTNEPSYQLVSDYHKLFTIDGENSTESLLEVQYVQGTDYPNKDEGTTRTIDFTPRSVFGKSGLFGFGMLNPTLDLVSQFDIQKADGTITHWDSKWVFNLATIPTDKRADIDGYLLSYTKINAPNLNNKAVYSDYDPRIDMIAKPGDSLYYNTESKWYRIKAFKGDCGGLVSHLSATGFWTMKTQSAFVIGDQYNPLNQPLLRLSDVLLLEAEAKYVTGNTADAVALVNKVRERARNSKWTPDSTQKAVSYHRGFKVGGGTIPKDLTTINSVEEIYLDRRVELFNEGVRFYDLVRWNKANDICSSRPAEYKNRTFAWKTDYSMLLPIPSRLIADGNGNVIQNPGY